MKTEGPSDGPGKRLGNVSQPPVPERKVVPFDEFRTRRNEQMEAGKAPPTREEIAAQPGGTNVIAAPITYKESNPAGALTGSLGKELAEIKGWRERIEGKEFPLEIGLREGASIEETRVFLFTLEEFMGKITLEQRERLKKYKTHIVQMVSIAPSGPKHVWIQLTNPETDAVPSTWMGYIARDPSPDDDQKSTLPEVLALLMDEQEGVLVRKNGGPARALLNRIRDWWQRRRDD